MKKEFTFAMMTYNQERYVVEQLESIKYQVLHYGHEYATSFLLCDDASNDRTVEIVTKWVEQEDLFHHVSIVVAAENVGIAANYSTLLRNVKTDRFKVLAGDDLYYRNNVYEVAEQDDFCITPLLRLSGKKVDYELDTVFCRLLERKRQTKEFLRRYMLIGNPNQAPSIFWNHKFVDDELFERLKKFKWIEDVPTFYHILSQEELHAKVLETPYVIYRVDNGISLNTNHPRYHAFREEEARLKREYFVRQRFYIGKFNPYLFAERIVAKLYRSVFSQISPHIKRFVAKMEKQSGDAELFYAEILAGSNEWIKKNAYD